MELALTTIVRGRSLHLARQARAVAALDPAPARYVVVSMDADPPAVPGARLVHMPVEPGQPLPLAAARNRAFAEAVEADLVVSLDADCLPAPDLLGHLSGGAARRPHALLAGPVGRLPALDGPPSDADLDAARRAGGPRPVPAAGELLDEPRYELFWSLAFAAAPHVHARIGGFDERYRGYGAEDTDYAFRAREAGVDFSWVGGAWSHHQHHPVSNPPVEHLSDIVRNARRFHARWGSWPMEGWLAAFAGAGLVEWEGDRLALTGVGAGPAGQR